MSKFEPELWGGSLPAANLTLYSTAGTGTSDYISFKTGSQSERLKIDTNGNVVVGSGALATNASNGFFYIPSTAGVPSGVPTSNSGRVPIDYDTVNDRLYFYNGGWKLIGSTGVVLNNDFTVEDFGAVGDGVTDDTAAIQDAIDAAIANGGGTVWFQATTYKFTSTLNIDGSYITLQGKGKNASKLLFVPAGDDTAILVDSGGGQSTWFCRIADLWLYSSNITNVKIGLDLVDVRSFFIDRFQISGAFNGIAGTDSWGGGASGSIGLRTKGREFILIDKASNISAERPIQHNVNPNNFIDLDHCRIEATVVATGYPCIEVEDGCYLSSTTWSGSWNGGTYGFYWSDTTATTASGDLYFKHLRAEQGQDTTKETFYISSSAAHQANGIAFDNVSCDIFRPGWYLRNINFVGIYNSIYGSTTKVAIDWDNTVEQLVIHGCYWQSGCTINKGSGVNTVFTGPVTLVNAPLSGEAYYSTRTATLTTDGLLVQSASSGATGAVVNLYQDSTSPAVDDAVGSIFFLGNDLTPTAQQYAVIQGIVNSPTAGAEFGNLLFGVTSNASNKNVLLSGSLSALAPNITDTFALGTSSLGWSDLHFAAGAVINWNAGAATLTESSSNLTFAGAKSGGLQFAIQNTDDGASGGVLVLNHISTTPAISDTVGQITFQGRDSGNNAANYGLIRSQIVSATDTTEASTMLFTTLSSGANLSLLFSGSSATLAPNTNDTIALGTTSLKWSDLHLADGAVINFNNGDVTLTHSTDTLTVASGTVKLAAGTTAIAPLQFQAGTNLTSAADGAMEWDGQALFFSPDASDRRIIPAVAITRLHAAYTLADSTTAQKMFNASANGALTLPTGSYIFECVVGIDAMSGTSGNAALSIIGAGGATVTNTLQVVVGIDGAKATAGAAAGASWSATNDAPAANTSVVTAGVSTEMAIMWKGSFEVTGAGTIIPSVDLITGGVTPAVKLGSYFMCWRMGAATDVTQGNWS